MQSIYRITPKMVPTADVDSGPRYKSKASSISRDTTINVSAAPAVSEAVQGEAAAQLISSTEVTLTNYNPREYRDAQYVLNSLEIRQWRHSLSEEFADSRYRIISISRATGGDKIVIGRKTSGNVGAEGETWMIERTEIPPSRRDTTLRSAAPHVGRRDRARRSAEPRQLHRRQVGHRRSRQ